MQTAQEGILGRCRRANLGTTQAAARELVHDPAVQTSNHLWTTNLTECRLPGSDSRCCFSTPLDCFNGDPAVLSIGESPPRWPTRHWRPAVRRRHLTHGRPSARATAAITAVRTGSRCIGRTGSLGTCPAKIRAATMRA